MLLGFDENQCLHRYEVLQRFTRMSYLLIYKLQVNHRLIVCSFQCLGYSAKLTEMPVLLLEWGRHACSVGKSCPTLSPPGSSVHGILQTRILGWVAIPFSKRSSLPRNGTQVSCIIDGFLTICAIREVPPGNCSNLQRKIIKLSFTLYICRHKLLAVHHISMLPNWD